MYMKHCSVCHSTGFVWQSGIFASEADSVAADMLVKDRTKIGSRGRNFLVEYLKSRLPKN